MFKYCLLTLLVYIGLGCKPPAKDCQRFRTGTFTLKTEELNYRFVRTETEQLETNLTTGVWHRLQVNWLDDCSYTLRLLETSVADEPITDRILTVTITKADQDAYLFDSQAKGGPVFSGRMQKVK